MNMRYVFIAMVVVFCGVVQPVHAGALEFFFPMLKDAKNDPSNTLQAPFADVQNTVDAEGQSVQKQADHNVPISQPHRTSQEISEWLVASVSEVMTFSGQNYKKELQGTEVYFDKTGRGQYGAFLQDRKIIDVLRSGDYQVRSYVESKPLLLNDGALNERYRWLYKVPIVVSYLNVGVDNYKGVAPVNQHIDLQVQVGRVDDVTVESGLKIERWTGKPQTSKKK